jgi:hypothetical protein
VWFRDGVLSEEMWRALGAERAVVAQKCTGRAKRPVFLFPSAVVKGPWRPEEDADRLNRELGRAALMRYWALPSTPCAVLESCVCEHPQTGDVYLVTPALYAPPTAARPWVFEGVFRSASAYGPRWLEVVSRASVGVVRVADRVREQPHYLDDAAEVWEHLIHRFLLGCGDSGLHNMLINPANDRAVGVDLDEHRGDERLDPSDWRSLLFKRLPARALMPVIEGSWRAHRPILAAILTQLDARCLDAHSLALLHLHDLDLALVTERLRWLRAGLTGAW